MEGGPPPPRGAEVLEEALKKNCWSKRTGAEGPGEDLRLAKGPEENLAQSLKGRWVAEGMGGGVGLPAPPPPDPETSARDAQPHGEGCGATWPPTCPPGGTKRPSPVGPAPFSEQAPVSWRAPTNHKPQPPPPPVVPS